ncbi:MAG: GNAT family N-acetyltransferase [Bacteroidetes bacterium]|nr:GNAT family N-acetyltransferase [Bacteroidota bacterium]
MILQPIISTERLILRNWQGDDIELFIQMNSDIHVMKYFPGVMTREQTLEFFQRIQHHFDEYAYGLFAVEEKISGDFIGFIGFSHPRFESFFTPCIEIGWRLKATHWNKGLATEGALACLNYGFSILNFDKIYSFTSIYNLPSINVMKKIGLKHTGDFNHPMLNEDSWLFKHILYGISRDEFNFN